MNIAITQDSPADDREYCGICGSCLDYENCLCNDEGGEQ